MFFATREWLRLIYLCLFTRTAIRPRVLSCVTFFALFPLVELFNAICLLLDGLLFPGCRRSRIEAPIFVIGNPRSGTTLLHRLMAEDDARFFCFRTWEIAFPSLLQKKVVSALGKLDRLTGDHLRAFLLRAEAARFEKFQPIHQIGLFLPEEDDKLTLHILASADLGWLFPFGDFGKMARFDESVDARDQRRIMDFYLRCVRRQAYFKGAARTFLSKNPVFSGRVATLTRYFPDGKIVYLVRNPLDVVPSLINLARVLRAALGIGLGANFAEALYEAVRYYYTYPLDQAAALPEDRFIAVNYEDLVRQPKQVIQRIYTQFGLPLTPPFEARLDREVARMERRQRRHEYSLDEGGITRERIVADLRPIFDRFGFDARDEGPPAALAPPPARAMAAAGPFPPPAA